MQRYFKAFLKLFLTVYLKTVKSKLPDEAPVIEEQIEASFNKEGIHGGLTCAPESDNRIVNGVDAKPRTYVLKYFNIKINKRLEHI